MSRQSESFAPVTFRPVLRDLERWRRSRVPGGRIPDELWKAAVRLAGEHGVSKTAIVLRLDYYSLKDRLEAFGRESGERRGRRAPAFVEVPLDVSPRVPDCVLQLEDGGRGRLRIELRGRAASDIEALALSLWNVAK